MGRYYKEKFKGAIDRQITVSVGESHKKTLQSIGEQFKTIILKAAEEVCGTRRCSV